MELDVRGQIFKIGKSTLTSVQPSELQAMFSGQRILETDAQGRVFLDRDPETFKYLINYLSSDRQVLPKNLDGY